MNFNVTISGKANQINMASVDTQKCETHLAVEAGIKKKIVEIHLYQVFLLNRNVIKINIFI